MPSLRQAPARLLRTGMRILTSLCIQCLCDACPLCQGQHVASELQAVLCTKKLAAPSHAPVGQGRAPADPVPPRQRLLHVNHGVQVLHAAAQDEPRVVELAAAKSRAGHSEACAGAVGLLSAARRLRSAAAPRITHLRAASAHVAGVLAAHGRRLAALLPRQACPGAGGAHLHAGVSAFAFQARPVRRERPSGSSELRMHRRAEYCST
jgi:hypothetical protein